MNLLKRYESLIIAAKLGSAIPVCIYYSSLKQETGLVDAPSYVWILALTYTALQFLNKQVVPEIPSLVSLFYYGGLLAIGLPVFLVTKFKEVDWLLFSKIGCWFLILSVLLQMGKTVQQKNKTA
ncbi:MAG: hypothetical protein FJX84_08840 [Bacteroidetes bacterium]|nr:hypothetical protein [Bacteroidota bacterium]